jgi:protein O-GlcNAc transferase
VVSLAGDAYWSRQGLALLSNVGHPELVAGHGLKPALRTTIDDYVTKAVALATDLPRLAGIRAGLCERMRRSAIVDGACFARKLEDAYRLMWREWCRCPAGSPS